MCNELHLLNWLNVFPPAWWSGWLWINRIVSRFIFTWMFCPSSSQCSFSTFRATLATAVFAWQAIAPFLSGSVEQNIHFTALLSKAVLSALCHSLNSSKIINVLVNHTLALYLEIFSHVKGKSQAVALSKQIRSLKLWHFLSWYCDGSVHRSLAIMFNYIIY